MSVRDKKKLYNKIMNNIKKLDTVVIGIGHFSDSGKTEDGEIDLAELMATHELGSKKMNIPARPVHGRTFRANEAKMRKLIVKLSAEVMMGGMRPEVAMALLGNFYEGALKEAFTKFKFKKLSANYKKRPSGKKVTPNSIPLVDTGNLRGAITWKRLR